MKFFFNLNATNCSNDSIFRSYSIPKLDLQKSRTRVFCKQSKMVEEKRLDFETRRFMSGLEQLVMRCSTISRNLRIGGVFNFMCGLMNLQIRKHSHTCLSRSNLPKKRKLIFILKRISSFHCQRLAKCQTKIYTVKVYA